MPKKKIAQLKQERNQTAKTAVKKVSKKVTKKTSKKTPKKTPKKATKKISLKNKSKKINKTNIGDSFIPKVSNGIILAIDPGTHKLGYSIYNIGDDEPLFYDVIYSDGIYNGKDLQIIIQKIKIIIDTYNITHIACEDYKLIKGKVNGIFQVPGLIKVLMYYWYSLKQTEVLIIPPDKWKRYITGIGNCNKDMVKLGLKNVFQKSFITKLKSVFDTRRKGKTDLTDSVGEQDCIDSICIGRYVSDKMANKQGEHL